MASRKLLQIKLEQAGIVCDAVENGVLALQMFKKYAYDVVVLDQYMPQMDGEQVAAAIRRTAKEIPLIAITSDDTLKPQLQAAGFNQIIVKPLRGDEAIKIIQMYL